ncbi:MAG: hypothetical protein K6360_06705 [Deltaproteobacteria bacterium]
MKIRIIIGFILLCFFVTASTFAFDLSSSDQDGRYPWDHTHIYEQVAVVNMPADDFNTQMMAIFAQTPFKDAMIAPMEMRPLTLAMLTGSVMQVSFSDEWEVITGEPNPVVAPMLTALYSVLTQDPALSQQIAGYLSSMPLMMPDSGGSAVLELKNKKYDSKFLDKGLRYALALPWKVGFWVEGDIVKIDIINPEAVVELFFSDLSQSEQAVIKQMASDVRISLEKALIASLSKLLPKGAFALSPAKLPPYITNAPSSTETFDVMIGEVADILSVNGSADIPAMLLNPGYPFNDSMFEIENPMMTMPVQIGSDTVMMHPLLFQTYSAFDGIASFLSSAYQNPTAQNTWIVQPNNMVIDDFMFLSAITYPQSPIYSAQTLGFYRQILTPMFQMTFLRPRGSKLIDFADSSGKKVYLVEIGSPYYGQVLLKLGAHRAPGTPCKVIAYEEDGKVKVLAYDTNFMFKYFFGDTDPTAVTDWDGAFTWPSGKGIDVLSAEAGQIHGGFLALALYGLGQTGAYNVTLSTTAMQYMQGLAAMAGQR